MLNLSWIQQKLWVDLQLLYPLFNVVGKQAFADKFFFVLAQYLTDLWLLLEDYQQSVEDTVQSFVWQDSSSVLIGWFEESVHEVERKFSEKLLAFFTLWL